MQRAPIRPRWFSLSELLFWMLSLDKRRAAYIGPTPWASPMPCSWSEHECHRDCTEGRQLARLPWGPLTAMWALCRLNWRHSVARQQSSSSREQALSRYSRQAFSELSSGSFVARSNGGALTPASEAPLKKASLAGWPETSIGPRRALVYSTLA